MIFAAMKNKTSRNLASLAVGAALLAPLPSATGQGMVNVNFGGQVGTTFGTGNGIANNSTVNGTVDFNLYNLLLIDGNGSTSQASAYRDTNATIGNIIAGNTQTFQGLWVDVFNNVLDPNNQSADGFGLSWGPSFLDQVDIYYPDNTISNTSINSFETMLNKGMNGSLSSVGDTIFFVGFDDNGNGAQGNLSTFQVVATPEPSTIAMGTLGAAGLLALRRMRGIKKNEPALNR